METIKFELHDSAKERPEKSCEVLMLVCGETTPLICNTNYSKKHDAFNASDWEETPRHQMTCDFWAYLPMECMGTGLLDHRQ